MKNGPPAHVTAAQPIAVPGPRARRAAQFANSSNDADAINET
jgi:hypothetical protein